MSREWFAVRTRPRCESSVAGQLAREGLETFSPLVIIRSEKKQEIPEPLFPGYLFLRMDLETFRTELLGARSGIFGWVRFGDSIPSVPDEVISRLMQRVRDINGSGGLWTRFGIGDIVRVMAGKLDCLGVVTREPASPRERVKVLLDFMGGKVAANVPWSSLQLSEADGTPKDRFRIPRRTRGRGRPIRNSSLRAAVAGRT